MSSPLASPLDRAHASPGRRPLLITLLAGTLSLLGACDKADTTQTAGKGSPDSSKGTLTVLTHDSFELPAALLAKFEEQSGYRLKTASAGDAGVANQLVLTKAHPRFDAVYGIDTYSAGLAEAEGVMADYASPHLPESARTYLRPGLTPIDLGDVCVNIDHDWFKTRQMPAPASFDDLARAEYARLLVLPNPATSSPGFAMLAGIQTLKGDEAGTWWQALLAGGARVASGWSEAYNVHFSAGEGKGQYPLVLSYASSPAASGGQTGILASTCVRQVEYAGVVQGGKHVDGARAFIDFLLSPEVQAAIPEAMYVYPIDDSVALPTEWQEHARQAEAPILPDAKAVNAQRQQWLRTWQALLDARR